MALDTMGLAIDVPFIIAYGADMPKRAGTGAIIPTPGAVIAICDPKFVKSAA